MKEFACSSDPSSRLNQLRWDLYWLRHLLGESNRGGTAISKSYIMSRQNFALADLRHHARSLRNPNYRKPEPECPHFETTVRGIPCGVRVLNEDNEYELLDRRGYRSVWLEERMTERDRRELYTEIERDRNTRDNVMRQIRRERPRIERAGLSVSDVFD